jgi:hypothetical protein
METVNPEMPSTEATPIPPRGLFGTGIFGTLCFAIGFVLFFLPFVELKCKDKKSDTTEMFSNNSALVFSNSVWGLAIGQQWKDKIGGMENLLGGSRGTNASPDKQEPNSYALGALVLAAAGFALSMNKRKPIAVLSMLCAVAVVVLLIMLMVRLAGQVDLETHSDPMEDMSISVNFTVWAYLSILLMLCAGYFSWRKFKARQ